MFKIKSASSSLDVWEYDELDGINKKHFKDALDILQITHDLAS